MGDTEVVCNHCDKTILEKESGLKCPKCRYDICAVCRAKEDMGKLVCLNGHLIKFYLKDKLKHRWDGNCSLLKQRSINNLTCDACHNEC